jgi:hypothetical protein
VHVGQRVADLAALISRHHQATTSQARQMIGHVGPREPQLGGQLAGVARPIKQGNQDLATSRVGQRPAQPGKGGLPRLIRQHL